MIELRTPRGLAVAVPEGIAEDPTPRFKPGESAQIRAHYDDHGYVVVSSVISAEVCARLRALWDSEVKPYPGFIYRQATARAERHVFGGGGWVMNPILNLQSLDPKRLGAFRDFATGEILTAESLAAVFRTLLDDEPKIVQSMYFEGNSATWEHQDSYYLDAEEIGRMAAAWIALEPIEARAGRFFVCPGSHRLEVARHSGANSYADHHDDYIDSVVAHIRARGLEIHAPRLEAGDVLFWNALTIHGSLDSRDPDNSRSSVTCHAIPASGRFLQFQKRATEASSDMVNGVSVFRPKDLARRRNRAVLAFESRFPRAFYTLKRAAIRRLTSRP